MQLIFYLTFCPVTKNLGLCPPDFFSFYYRYTCCLWNQQIKLANRAAHFLSILDFVFQRQKTPSSPLGSITILWSRKMWHITTMAFSYKNIKFPHDFILFGFHFIKGSILNQQPHVYDAILKPNTKCIRQYRSWVTFPQCT